MKNRNIESTIVEKCKNMYSMDGYVDLLINPDIFCNDLGLTCSCMKDESTLERIAYGLHRHGILVMKYSDGLIRIEDKKHRTKRQLKNALIGTIIGLALAAYIAIFF